MTGGTVVRSNVVPDLAGWYLFGDYCTGQIWALDPTAPAAEPRAVEIAELSGVVAITSGPEAEVYVVSNAGTVARLIAAMFGGFLVTFFVFVLDMLGIHYQTPLWAYFAAGTLVGLVLLDIVLRV